MKTPSIIPSKEEMANILTHGLAFLLALVGTPILIAIGIKNGSFVQVLGLGVFCFSILMVYAASTISHSVINKRLKHIFRIVDHISIYFLIAGTHTPLVLLYLHRPMGWIFLSVLWSLVLLGVIFKIYFTGKYEGFSIFLYIGMGWSGMVILPEMFAQMNAMSLNWLIIGGVFYSTGVIFYVWHKLPYHHAIWHLFVIAGSISHFLAMISCFL